MCGIAGIISPEQRELRPRLCAMLEAEAHRGPDDRGELVDGALAIGQDRLSIIDLTDCGHQPMLLDGGRLAVVFNGEIFNYVELRAELVAKGRVFASQSDTEVILHGYDEWGTSCCERFNGMWAFALWDRAANRLVCSRDRFGVKPFYYSLSNGEFLFASEIKALIAASPRLASADEAYLARFLATSLIDDGERTCFAEVRQLLPAHTMVVDHSADVPRIESVTRYWSFEAERSRATYDYSDPARTMRELLGDSVRLRLRSDVPVGTCLSGGLDSSSIVGLASAHLGGPVWTYSALYPQRAYDESDFVRLVNDAFPTVPHEIRPEPGDLLDVMSRLAWHQDEPTAGPGLYSQWHVMQGASADVKVLLDGQGADELLGGYRTYYVAYLRSRLQATLSHMGGGSIARLARDWSDAHRIVPDLDRQLLLSFLGSGGKRLWRTLAGRGHRPEVRREFLEAYVGDEVAPPSCGDPLSSALCDATFRTSLPALLRYEDRNSMAFSIEARTPFLDYRLGEFALALPFDERIDGEWTKAVLRRAMADTLPPEVTWRRDKLGYPTPFCDWSRTVFREEIEEVIASPRFRRRGVFDNEAVQQMWRDHLAGAADRSWNVWRWLSVELWFERFIDGRVGA